MSWNRLLGWGSDSGGARYSARRLIGIGVIAGFALGMDLTAQAAVVRQPYLQLETPTSITVVWRTDNSTDSRVRYGTVQGSLTSTATTATVGTSHIVTITGLSPATKYFYDVGSTSVVQAGGTAEHYFVTAPTPGSSPSFRAWIVGDSGNGSSQQIAVRNAMVAYTGVARPDFMLHVGDIAYTSGSETEFTDFHFTMYQDILRHTTQWPTLGNHEGASTTSGQPGTSTGPYYDAFVLPTAAEAGGVASGTEAYYSFNYGNTHFISLNSYQVSRSPSGPMATWLQSDLAATNAQWIVAFWHHPPYTHGTHNSDVEGELREMRQNILPILEAGGVDLVITGHSHIYERSYLIDGTYSTPTPDFATLQATGHILDDGNGKPTGDGPYQKGSGAAAHAGAVYVVAGHGGAATGGTLDHPVMYFSETLNGSCLLDVTASTLTLTNVRSSGVVSDTFQIVKGPQSPKVASANPSKSAVLTSLPNIQVVFSTGVTGVDAGDLSVNGSPATSMSGAPGGTTYTFSGYAAPANGHVGVVLAAGGIADATNPGLQFTGNVWSYTIDTTPPRVATEAPVRSSAVGVLPSINVSFTKGVTGVVAADLIVNGSPATSLSGVPGSAGPYTFTGYAAPSTGLVNVTLLANGIQDEQAQPFAGDEWVYVLRPHLVINEYLTSNNTSAQDPFGEFDDYIEVYNPSNVEVDMSGMHLTDTLDFPAQYEIPDGVVIPAHGHLLFWCDSQPQQGPMHTNFNLARAAEAAGLFDTAANGFATIDTTSWVEATTDVPKGRFPDGATGLVNVLATPGATNSIACTTSPQCSALNDACNVGVCTSNHCVAQPANEGQACDDGIACRGPDTCTAGVCDGGASSCTAGETCNFVTGLCETPLADPLPVAVGATYKYFKGTTAPPATWNETSFDDSTWLSGASGFGYGPDCVAQHGTVLSDMINTYGSLYVRHLFRVDNPGAVTSLLLTMDYDDGFVAYINGHEVARNNVTGTPPSNTQPATADHECSNCAATCNPSESFPINLGTAQLVAGNNVLAIQGHNLSNGSSDFTLVPALTATEGQSCAVNPECEDENPCTDDACVAGACQHTADDTNACSDGIGCTTDSCSAGACVSVAACPGGQTCNMGSGVCEAAPVTVSFQQGAGSPVYTGAVDTFIQSGSATNNAAVTPLTVDGVPPVTDERQILIRFDGLFGSGTGQIPPGATITSATLTVNVSNAMAQLTSFNKMLQTWNPSGVWTTYGSSPWNATPGIQADGVEAVSAADPGSPASVALSPPLQSISVTSSVQDWASNPSSNFGWVLRAAAADSLVFDSAEAATVANRPKLTVTYTYIPPCGTDADCSDNNVCNGIETCVATVCQPGTALACGDANVCTTDTCHPVDGCANANNTNPCSDGDACTANDTCAGGVCVPGGPASCDDGNVCTNDSCSSGAGCAHANNTASCSDGSLCTTGDVCGGGTCSGAPVTCPVGSSCNPGTGLCSAAPVTTSFQDGVGGYVGTQDTYLAQAAPGTVEGALDNWRWDTENPAPSAEFGLIRFDGIVGTGPGQVPASSTVTSATLTLEVTNGSVAPAGSINESTVDWAEATATWTNFGGDAGVQADEYLASPQYAAPLATGSVATDVTASVQAWVNGTRSNFGWVFRPNNTDGAQVDSAEFSTVALRPKLSITYSGAAGCTTNAQCDDANACNGVETCVTGSCQAGTPVTCPVGQTCNPGTGTCQGGSTTVSFQQGAAGYLGSADTYIDAALGSQAGVSPIVIDGSPVEQALLRFDGIFGNGAGQIPAGSTVTSATLTLWVGTATSDESTDTVSFHRLLHAWNAPDVWAAYGVAPWNAQGGIQADGVDAAAAATATATMSALGTAYPINVTTSLQAWSASPSSNFGWVILPPAAGTNGLRLESSESTTSSNTRRPLLSVTFTAPASGCVTNADCNDNNACNGIETCVSTVCQPGTALNCNDGNVCTTDSCVPATGCVNANNTAACNDGNACTTGDVCAGGSCTPGAALSCDDGNVCTNDSCVPATGCAHANNTASCSDGSLCTTGDVCGGGTCSGTPVTCPVGSSCNPGTGLCSGGTVTTSFQDGAAGYVGTQDTYLSQASPGTVEGALDNWRWDSENPAPNAEFGLIRFDNIVGTGTGQVPASSTITSATLTLEVTNNSVAPAGSINESTVDWAEATATWNNFGGEAGVQADEYLASPQYAAPLATGTAVVDVTASVQAWVSGTRSNFGWVVRPNNLDGAQVDSAEFATVALRPKLTVTYSGAAGCTTNAQCDDANACNGLETCVAGSCQAGTPVTCPGGQTCNPGTGVCESAPVTVSFQQGAGSPVYTGAVDTFIQSGSATNNAAVTPLTVDGVPPVTDERQILIRFDGLFGSGTGQIPPGATITSATLTVNVSNAMAQLTSFNRLLRTWSPSDVWAAYGVSPWNATPGIQADGVEAVSADDPGSPASVALSPPLQSITVTSSVQAWSSNPSGNHGWVLRAAAADSLVFDSAEATTLANRPKLTVTYVPTAEGRMECSPSSIAAGSGSTADLTVVLRNLGGLDPVRGYQTQISIVRTAGTGTVSVGCPNGVEIDDARPDYLYFNSSADSTATNCTLRRAAGALLSGGATVGPTPAYLSSYTLTTSADATAGSTFSISLDAVPGSSLVATDGSPLAVDLGPACTLTIGTCGSAAECDDGNACTVDTCHPSLGCQHAAVVCNDTNPCTDDSCNPLNGACVFNADDSNTCTDGDACTSDACSAGACVHSGSGVCGVSGTVRYYRDDAGAGTEPSTKPVPNVGIDGTGDATADATTLSAGTYGLPSLFGNVTVTTVAKYGTPRASDHNGAISSFDASLVARGAALLVTLSTNQNVAADVTGDGTVSAFDASFVARFAAGLIDHFNVATTTGSDWRFLRCDAYAYPGDPGCGAPSYAFTPISQAEAGKDFYAVLYGDVTGNWQPAAPFASLVEKSAAPLDGSELPVTARPEALRTQEAPAPRSPALPPAEVSIDRLPPLRPGERRELAIRLENADGILGIDFDLRFDPSRVRIVGIQTSGIAAGWGLAHSDRPDGVHRITTYGMTPLSGSGTMAIVTVEGIQGVGPFRPLQIEGTANEGAIPLRAKRGVPSR